MSLNADFIYNNDWHDVSNRVVFNYFSALHPNREDDCSIECQVELHKMLCDILYKEQMDEETISSVRNAIKAIKSNLEVCLTTNHSSPYKGLFVEVCLTTNHSSPYKGLFVEVWYDGSY